ncbi:beta-mannosidase [Ciona intestinalis]
MFCNFVVIGLVILLQYHFATSEGIVQDLGGSSWTASGTTPPSNVIVKLDHATVPGCVHTDWFKGKGHTDDPYYGFNDDKLKWIAESNWTYSRTFQVITDVLNQREHWLVMEGVDTFADVVLNGKVLGRTSNMFLIYRFNITGILQKNFNMLVVGFTSAVTTSKQCYSKQPYPIPPVCPPDVQHGFCHVNVIRFGAIAKRCPIFPHPTIYNYILTGTSKLLFDLKLQTAKVSPNMNLTGNFTVEIKELNIRKNFVNFPIPAAQDSSPTVSISIDMNNVGFKRWWPNGYGMQSLYNISVYHNSSGHDMTGKHFRFGFRKVELVQQKISNNSGLSFYFRINDMPVFAKGANWIPADAFKNRITTERFENVLGSARDAHMNMLRVWGGGVYEDDRLYDIADQYGIMLWQDFMFACAMYPASDEFLSNVTQEVLTQVNRLKHHPSIVIWAGNNENEAALSTNWYNTSDNFDRYKKDYVALYADTILPIVNKLDPSRPFLTSSPTNGKESTEEGYVAKDPYSVHYGDVHYYNYNDDCLDWTKFPKTRFASEYGFQSWPSFEAVQRVSEANDWTITSDWSEHRNHHGDGNKQMLSQIMMHFQIPDSANTTQDFINTIYLTQIMQGLCYKAQTEFYRRSRNELVNGTGHTMGALYWQLNDIWEAPTWSSTEYEGKWKALHYFAKDFFAPVALSAYDDDTVMEVYAMSDVSNNISDTVVVTIRTWSTFSSVGTFSQQVTIPAHTALNLFQESVGTLLHYGNCPYKELCYISVSLLNSPEVPVTHFFPVPFKNVDGLSKANIKVQSVVMTAQDIFTLNLTSDVPALFVWLEAPGVKGRFSENAIVMYKSSFNITFYAWESGITAEKLKSVIIITSYNDIHQVDKALLKEPSEDIVVVVYEKWSWLDNDTAKLTFGVIGMLFIVLAAVQVTCLVMRLNTPNKHRPIKRRSSTNNKKDSLDKTSNSSTSSFSSAGSESTQVDDEAMAFLIQSKRGYGHQAKKTEIRFYVI